MSKSGRTTTALALGGLLLAACAPEKKAPDDPAAVIATSTGGESATATEAPRFVDIAGESGLDFVHWNGMSGELYFAESVGSGGALVDIDADGDLDVFLVQGRMLTPSPDEISEEAAVFPPPARRGSRLFRNDLEAGRPTFVDITEESGLAVDLYGMGVAAGDVDNDGRVDLYVTAFGSNQLWRNVSEGGRVRFENVTEAAGVDDPRWSTSAAFTDLDGDGFLDLFVVNYVDFRLSRHRQCVSPGGRPDYCGPQVYNGETDRLFRNRGDGTFEDVSGAAGLLAEPSSGLGVVAADFDLDGRIDLYVANDLRRNLLWLNRGSAEGIPQFDNVALERGAAVSMLGQAQASMGVVAGDFDNDGDDDLFMTHLTADTNTLYLNLGGGHFADRSAASGLGAASLAATGFGTVPIDIDNDGFLDLATANGAVKRIEAQVLAGEVYPMKQPNQLFRNRGDGVFSELREEEFARLEVSRGFALGDVDNDGRADLLLTNNAGPARLLHNRNTSGNAWIGLLLLTQDGRDALGARVAVRRRGAPTLWRRAATDGSYLCAGDPRVLVGLGDDDQVEGVEVFWPGGGIERWGALEPGRYHTLVAGAGDSELAKEEAPGG